MIRRIKVYFLMLEPAAVSFSWQTANGSQMAASVDC